MTIVFGSLVNDFNRSGQIPSPQLNFLVNHNVYVSFITWSERFSYANSSVEAYTLSTSSPPNSRYAICSVEEFEIDTCVLVDLHILFNIISRGSSHIM